MLMHPCVAPIGATPWAWWGVHNNIKKCPKGTEKYEKQQKYISKNSKNYLTVPKNTKRY